MENDMKVSEQLTDFVNKLSIVRDDYVATKNELHNSIRKDIVKAELKDILYDSKDFDTLKINIEKYISNL